MKAIRALEMLGYRFHIAIDYTGPERPSLEAGPLLEELTANREEAILWLTERHSMPSRIRSSSQYRAAITRGILEGDSPVKLLNQAVECIGCTTGDALFLEQNRENIKAVYGVGLLEPAPLEMELADVRKRLALLTRPELDGTEGDERRRIENAVKAHRAREVRIIKMLEKGA